MSGSIIYAYVGGNPVNFTDPSGLATACPTNNASGGFLSKVGVSGIYTLQVSIHIPLTGGIDLGLLYNTGSGEKNGLQDIGAYSVISKNISGSGLFKSTVGVTQTLGGRDMFDGSGSQLNVGAGSVGMGASNFNSNNIPQSLSFSYGPQLGIEAAQTQTNSLTVGDFARALGKLIYGPLEND